MKRRRKIRRPELKRLLKEDPTLDRVRDALENKCSVYQYYGK